MNASARRQIAIWLFACCAMVFLTMVVGGVTRLTHSGLSIVEWKPLIGALPPGFSTTGSVTLNGRAVMDLPTQDRRIGLLYQDDVLFPHLSVEQNLGFGLTPGIGKAERRAHIHAMLDRIGLAGLGPRDPATLSGGQRARVALASRWLSSIAPSGACWPRSTRWHPRCSGHCPST